MTFIHACDLAHSNIENAALVTVILWLLQSKINQAVDAYSLKVSWLLK